MAPVPGKKDFADVSVMDEAIIQNCPGEPSETTRVLIKGGQEGQRQRDAVTIEAEAGVMSSLSGATSQGMWALWRRAKSPRNRFSLELPERSQLCRHPSFAQRDPVRCLNTRTLRY